MSEIFEKMERKTKITEACQMSERFVDIFYSKMDRNRSTIGKIFLENSTLTWNGNHVEGEYQIHFFTNRETVGNTQECVLMPKLKNIDPYNTQWQIFTGSSPN
jgi:hypothetical protein